MKEKRTFLFIFAGSVQWRGETNFRERKSNFSLDFPVFRPSDFVGLKSKVILHCNDYAWAPVLGSFDKLQKVGVFPT